MAGMSVLGQLEGFLQVARERATVIASNMANANTPGYSRQVVSLSSQAYTQNGTVVGAGVAYTGTTSVRDQVLGLAINAKNSEQSSLTAQNAILTQVNSDFSSTTTGIGADLSNVFSSLSALSTNSSDPSAREAVLTAAGQLVNSFHQGAASLISAGNTANQQVAGTVAQINQLTSQIGEINGVLAQSGSSIQDGGALEDQRDTLTTQLAQLIGISLTQTDSTPTLTTGSGSPLVVGSTAYALQVTTASDGKAHVIDSQGQDITSKLSGGTLGGAIAVRDTTVPALSSQLDGLAFEFASAMNAAQNSGYDAAGTQGAPMFTAPTTPTGAAQMIAVALNSGSGLALSSSFTLQDTSNLASLLAVETTALPSGASPGDTYADFVGQVGATGSRINTQLTATTASLGQLTAQRDTESGVSVDEETVNLVRFQQAYAAAAKVIATLNSLYSTLLNMTSPGGS